MNRLFLKHIFRRTVALVALLVICVGGIMPHHHHGSATFLGVECAGGRSAESADFVEHDAHRTCGHHHVSNVHPSYLKVRHVSLPGHVAMSLPLWLAACFFGAAFWFFFVGRRALLRRPSRAPVLLPERLVRSVGGLRAPPLVVVL